MAPEQCAGNEPGPSADLYSLGVIAYKMLTGRVPFSAAISAATPAAVIIAQIQGVLPSPRSINPDLDETVEAVLAKAPADRYATGADLVRAIADAQGAAVPAPVAPAASSPLQPSTSAAGRMRRRSTRPLVIAAVVTVLVLAGSGLFLSKFQSGGVIGGATRSSPSAEAIASPSPSPTGAPLHAIPAKGPLVWQAALDGSSRDVVEPRIVLPGAATDSAIKLEKGYMEFDVLKPGANTGYGFQKSRVKSYVAEIDVSFKPGSDVSLWWTIGSDPDPTTGGYALYIDGANEAVRVFHQASPPPDRSTATAPVPGLQKGRVETIAIVVIGSEVHAYVNEQRVLDFNAGSDISATTGQLFINGQGGWFRITGIRYYALP